ncbi:MAG: KUP/HAK/KT family potassium transporter [Deltaproteobacteria bacterium]|nr:KUP/HAK/KT family potassium transporter [Deltaproteobacteria bacterium]MBW2071337.1 KUP/HAK/KT family potassium transporter [Deltaproteobacteria bacterium]
MVESKNSVTLSTTLFLTYLAIGGVLGDIGTSPLYVMSLSFRSLPLTRENVMGVLSLIFWSFVFLSSKYAWMALNMDNNGEGGTFALLNLIRREARKSRGKVNKAKLAGSVAAIAAVFSMICGALLLSDGVITPSISVLAAIEGIEVVYPHLAEYIIPLAVVILSGLFMLQKRGTEKIARLFSPIIIVWFAAIGTVGFINLRQAPWLIKAVSPYYALTFFQHHPIAVVFPILGYVVLCITGGEALYADEAHYSRPAIRLAWGVAAICLLANYFGQGAFILSSKEAVNPFFAMAVPIGHWVYICLLILATMAAIIASQAMITGSFSTYKQAMELRMFPRLLVRNTSPAHPGQIYIPGVNRGMFVACLATVFIFRSSDALGNAYGLAVTGAFIGTTLMMASLLYLRSLEKKSHYLLYVPLLLIFLLFDSGFFFSNLGKIPTGGWFPLLIGTFLVISMIAWEKGSWLLYQNIPKTEVATFLEELQGMELVILPGTNIYMTANENIIPACLLEEYSAGSLKQNLVLVTVKNTELPWGVQYEKKLLGRFHNGDGTIHQVRIDKGYMRLFVNVPKIMNEMDFSQEPRRFVFGMWNPLVVERSWKKWLLRYFRVIYQNSPSLTQRFMIPASAVIYVGGDVEIAFRCE